MVEIPTLETERLIMRAWRESDLDAYAAMMGHEDIGRFLGGPLSRPDAWRSLAGMLGHWVLRGYGLWAVDRKSDGALVGRVGLINPEGWPALEVGWTLARPYWGQGYATEAARAALRHAFAITDLAQMISLIHPENRASQKVAERLGEVKGGRTTVYFNGKTHEAEMWTVGRERFS